MGATKRSWEAKEEYERYLCEIEEEREFEKILRYDFA